MTTMLSHKLQYTCPAKAVTARVWSREGFGNGLNSSDINDEGYGG
jgi:hypothetical protein